MCRRVWACLVMARNGCNRLLVLLPDQTSHGKMRILEKHCMLLPKVSRLQTIKATMALIAHSTGGINCAFTSCLTLVDCENRVTKVTTIDTSRLSLKATASNGTVSVERQQHQQSCISQIPNRHAYML